MGVYIKGMELPESCYYCPFADGSWDYSPPHKARCIITGENMPIDERGVQHNQVSCPLVPVPPHGRLIDADALLTDKAVGTKIAGWGKMFHETCIEYAPTIIPADPPKEEA